MVELHTAESHPQWVQMSADFILESARLALAERPRFVLALSGGSTPEPVFQILPELWEAQGLDWEHVHLLWGDERCVPLDHPQSNYRMAREGLIDKIDIPGENVHPMRCAEDPTSAAAAYEAEMRALYPQQPWPDIDLILLGLGTDGHTASLFPASKALEEHERWVAANEVQGFDVPRLTLTIPAINAAKKIAFLVAGADKADMVRRIRSPREDKPIFPAQAIRPSNGELHWIVDKEAVSELE